MQDNRNPEVKKICDANVNIGCGQCCPLAEPCCRCHGEPKVDYDVRVNKAAEAIESDDHMLFHECPLCNGRCNCGSSPCECDCRDEMDT
jgi:hypothetical protein